MPVDVLEAIKSLGLVEKVIVVPILLKSINNLFLYKALAKGTARPRQCPPNTARK